jgi:hypothetical protein
VVGPVVCLFSALQRIELTLLIFESSCLSTVLFSSRVGFAEGFLVADFRAYSVYECNPWAVKEKLL